MSVVTDSINDRTERNRVAATRLAVARLIVPAIGAILVLVVVSFVVSWYVAVPLAVVIVAAAMWDTRRRVAGATRSVSTIVGGRLATEDAYPRLHNLIEAMTVSAGVEAPELRILDDDAINLFVAGAPAEAVLVATSGLLDALDRIELEGVLAHGLARIRCYDAYLGAQAAVLVGGPLLRGGSGGEGAPSGAAGAFAERRIQWIRDAFGPDHDVLCDFAAVDVTHYPPGLASAFRKIAASGAAVGKATWGTAHMWLVDPFETAESGDPAAERLRDLVARTESLSMRADLMEEL